MSIRDEYDSKTPKQRKTIRIIGVFVALVILAAIIHACSGPAQAQLVGRSPEPVHVVGLTVQTTAGRRVDGMTVAVLPPIGYVFVDARGARWRIVGGEFGPPSCSSTKCGIRATVTVDPDGASKPTG